MAGAGVAAANDSATTEGNRLVARQDDEVSAALLPPTILGRQFWNMLSYSPPAPSRVKLMEKHVLSEAMVRDAARCYWLPDLRDPNGPPLAVSAARLLKLDPDPRVPFAVYTSAGRPPFKCMDDFQVDKQVYEKWKREHPNFLGFWTGVEWDNEYVTPLTSPKSAAEWARKHGCSETAIGRMQALLARASASRDGAVEAIRECHAALRRYYFDDPEKMIFLRAAWCFDHYALEWGGAMLVSETTNTGPYRHQISMFHARGAARQYGKPWQWYIATYYNGHDKNQQRSVNNEPNYLSTTRSATPGAEENSGPGFGMSISLSRRDKYLAYLAGASMVQHEDWPRAYCQPQDGNPKEWVLSPHGEAMKEWYGFTQRHPDRGVSYAPVALLVPFNQGMPQWGGNAWSHFPSQRPDMMIDAFMYTAAPFSQNTRLGQEGCLANSEFGDIYDVLLPNPPSGPISLATLKNYKVAILLGKLDVDAPLAQRLTEFVRQGGTLIINAQQAAASLPAEFLGVKRTGKTVAVESPVSSVWGGAATLTEPYDYEPVELCGAEPLWSDSKGGVLASVNRVGQGRVVLTTVDYLVPRKQANMIGTTAKMPLVELLMRQVVKEVLPIAVQGDIEYGLNKVSDGWWVYLINNKGVTKYTTTPEEFNPAATAKVMIDLRSLKVNSARELRADKEIALEQGSRALSIDVGPGDIRIVKLTTR
jgi:hypothetical protein